ncbi:MAG: hypothetical protein QOC66_4336 [Pseudonocardiales bacterium]|jgi:hypothetical protein|nr:hypothetical protein [Pseudonocardiales bacterium]
MTRVTDAEAGGDDVLVVDDVDLSLLATLAAALVVGAALVLTARAGATPLLIAVAAVQALFAVAWVFGTVMPGRVGGLVIATLAAAAADVTTSVWPDGRLGTLLAVLGLAVPAMFVHQLGRGAARVQVVSSLSAVALLVLGEVSLPALLQLRHEFGAGELGGRVVATAVAAVAGALVIGCLVDILLPAPRFDPAVGRGLLGLIASGGLGGSVGYLMLRDQIEYADGRSTFVGAALGALAGLLAIATAFVLHTTPEPATALGRRLRPVLAAVLPIAVIAPVAFLLCLAIRS